MVATPPQPTAAQQIIDIAFVIDAATLVETGPPGTPSEPTSVGTDSIWVLVQSGNAVFGSGTSDLEIRARTLDEIRWRATSLSLNAAYDVILYDFVPVRGTALISTPQPLEAEVTTPLPDPSDPTKPGSQTIHNYFWDSTVVAAGEMTYAFRFMVVDRAGTSCGYFFWDPFITITS